MSTLRIIDALPKEAGLKNGSYSVFACGCDMVWPYLAKGYASNRIMSLPAMQVERLALRLYLSS